MKKVRDLSHGFIFYNDSESHGNDLLYHILFSEPGICCVNDS